LEVGRKKKWNPACSASDRSFSGTFPGLIKEKRNRKLKLKMKKEKLKTTTEK